MSTLKRLRQSSGVARLSWGLIDQGFSSATNLGLAVIAGRVAGPGGLGVVYLGFAAYLMILTMQRALITDPLVVVSGRHSAAELPTRRGLAIVIGAASVTSMLLLVVGLLLPAPYGLGLLVFVPWLGIALVQDFWRAVLFRDGRGAAAACNDGLWAAVMLATLPLLLVSHDLWIVVLPWGAGAFAGGAIGFIQTGLSPAALRTSLHWWVTDAWALARWLAAETLLLIIQLQSTVYAVTAILGAADVGGLRSVQAVFAPMTLLAQAISLPGLPMLTKLRARSRQLAHRWAFRLSALAVGLVLMYLLIVALLPGHLLGLVFGHDFDRFGSLIPPVAVLQLIAAASLGYFILVKAERRGRALLLSRAISAASTVVLTITLAVTSGLTAAVWGMTIAWATGVVSIMAFALRKPRDDRESQAAASSATTLAGRQPTDAG